MRAISSRGLVVAAFALVLAGCPSTVPTPTPTPVPPVVTPQPVPPPAVTPAPTASNATTLDAYKRDLAQRIHQVHAARIFPGRPPEVLHAVVVLQMVVDANGTPSNVRVLRTPSYAQSEARDAVQSVYAAGPLPRPSARVLGRGRTIEFTESWLFRADGRYQIRSLALPQ